MRYVWAACVVWILCEAAANETTSRTSSLARTDVWYESYQVKLNGKMCDLCSACVAKLPEKNRAVPKKRRFDKEVI